MLLKRNIPYRKLNIIIIKDLQKYDIQVAGIAETHIIGEGLKSISVNKDKYKLYHVGDNSHHGVGIIVDENLNPSFGKVSERICSASLVIDNHKINIISVYAPTLEISEIYPEKRETFYEQLDKEITKNTKANDTTIILGDFNAKTGSGFRNFPQQVGKYGKGYLNENGRHLLELAQKHNMYLTNTTFKHKLCHRTTWTSPQKIEEHNYHDGTVRKNQYRNQIDYILIKNNQRRMVIDSRSYGGIETSTDHKIVKMSFRMEWWKIREFKPPKRKPDLQKLQQVETRTEFKREIKEKVIQYQTIDKNATQLWETITNM